jgi:hypothetical protein
MPQIVSNFLGHVHFRETFFMRTLYYFGNGEPTGVPHT